MNLNEPVADIFAAARQGKLEEVKRFVEDEKVSYDSKDKDGNTALHWACFHKRTRVVDYLLSKGCDLHAVNSTERNTALHWAVMSGAKSIVGRLINRGANEFHVDRRGYGCLHIAAQYGHTTLALFFLDRGIPVDAIDLDGHAPLHWAAYMNNVPLIRLFLRHAADVDKTDKKGMAPVHWAVTKGHMEATAALVEAGAHIDRRDALDRLPIDHALSKNLQNLIRYLTAHSRFTISHKSMYTGRAACGVAIPVFTFLALVSLPIYFALPVLALFGALFIRFSGPLYPGLYTNLANPFIKYTAMTVYALCAYVYFYSLEAHMDSNMVEAVVFIFLNVVYVALWLTLSYTNPGFIPKDPQNEYAARNVLMMISMGESEEADIPEVCTTCMAGQPLRSSHCTVCNRCVALKDHHSPWSNNCVGHRSLWLYLISTVLNFVINFMFFFILVGALPGEDGGDNGFFGNLLNAYSVRPQVFYVFLLNILMLLSSIGAVVERYRCLKANMTSDETRNPYAYPYFRSSQGLQNPFDTGSIISNTKAMLCDSSIDYTKMYHIPRGV